MTKRTLTETIPVAPLKIIAMNNCRQLGEKANNLVVKNRKKMARSHKHTLAFLGYEADSYLVDVTLERMATGEGTSILAF